MSREVPMTESLDYYEVLQVHPKASPLMIKKAYRTLLLSGGHPDLGGDKTNAQLLTEAYEILSDPDKRLAYDRKRNVGKGGVATILISICPHCGVYNRVRSETKLLVARCGKCGQSIGKPKAPTTPLKKQRTWPWRWMLGGTLAVLILVGSGVGYALWNDQRDPLQEAIDLEDHGQLTSAAERLQALIATNPRSLIAHQHLGQVLEAQKKFEPAISEYEETVRIAPTSPKGHYLLGRALMRQGDLPEAETSLRRAVDLDGQDVGSLVALGNLLVRTKQTDQAVGLYRRAIALDARNSDLYYNLGAIYQMQRDWADAEKSYRQALTIDPRHREAIVNLGKLYLEQGNAQAALTQFERAKILRFEDADLHYQLGELYRQSENSGLALQEYRICQEQAKNNPALSDRVQRALLALGGQATN